MIEIKTGDALTQLATLHDESIHSCVTSPPYWGLRDYGTGEWEGGDLRCDHIDWKQMRGSDPNHKQSTNNNGFGGVSFGKVCELCGAKRVDAQLGLEATPEEYVGKMVEIFREVRRVLRKDGSLWLNLGDSYWGGGNGPAGNFGNPDETRPNNSRGKTYPRHDVLKPKDLCGIPWRVAFALQADGWWLRSDIIWAKPNPMPESVTDRPTKSHEYMFLLSKSASYFYDAEAIKEKSEQIQGPRPFGGAGNGKQNLDRGDYFYQGDSGSRNKRSVWTIATAPYPEAHFATYPPDLVKPCIMAGTSAKGCCAKCGAPWERVVERESLRRNELPKDHEHYRPAFYVDGKAGDPQSPGPGQAIVNVKTLGWEPTCACVCECDEHIYPVEPCTVLDPFAGSGTTGMVALELGRRAVLIELNPKYVQLIKDRCNVTPGLALA